MRNNDLLWILVLGGVAYWLFYKKGSPDDNGGNGGNNSGQGMQEFDPYDPAKTAEHLSNANFAKAGNPNGQSTANLPVAEASVSFL